MRRCTLSSAGTSWPPTYEAAVYRARNVAAPQRARQLGEEDALRREGGPLLRLPES